jgi:hypothetical protein
MILLFKYIISIFIVAVVGAVKTVEKPSAFRNLRQHFCSLPPLIIVENFVMFMKLLKTLNFVDKNRLKLLKTMFFSTLSTRLSTYRLKKVRKTA